MTSDIAEKSTDEINEIIAEQFSFDHFRWQQENTKNGYIKALEGKTEINHIPDWYSWERECVKKEIDEGLYSLEGFELTGADGKLDYKQKPERSYSLNSDFYWYEKGNVINIGNKDMQFYCIPRDSGDIVAKARLATEEMYKILKKNISEKV